MDFASSFDKGRPVMREIKRRKHQHILDVFEKEDPKVIEALQVIMF